MTTITINNHAVAGEENKNKKQSKNKTRITNTLAVTIKRQQLKQVQEVQNRAVITFLVNVLLLLADKLMFLFLLVDDNKNNNKKEFLIFSTFFQFDRKTTNKGMTRTL